MKPRATPASRSASLTDTLCTRCGLCCDGTLFADVELAGSAEATRVEILGLEVEDDGSGGTLLIQPCRALKARRCGIYAHRPGCCRTFECRLLQEVRRGTVTVERARERISEARSLIHRIETQLSGLGRPEQRLPLQERCDEALVRDSHDGSEMRRKRAELESTKSALERMIRETFLGKPHS